MIDKTKEGEDMVTATAEQTMNGTIAPARQAPMLPATAGGDDLGILGALVDSAAWNRLVKVAEIFAGSTIVPDHFRGNIGNCVIAIQMSLRLKCDPFMLMQHLYIVHGKPGFEAKFAIALANERNAFRGPIRFEMSGQGKTRQCTAWAIDRETGERVQETISMDIASAEGWTKKSGSKWLTIPDMMLKYRSASWLIRTTCPEVLMGMQTTDEIEDVATNEQRQTIQTTGRPAMSVSESLAQRLKEKEPIVDATVEEPATEAKTEEPEKWPVKAMSYDAILKAIGEAKTPDYLSQLMDEVAIAMSVGQITQDGATKLGNQVEIQARILKGK